MLATRALRSDRLHAVAGPPDDAYGRVTNPERFEVVQRGAADLIDDLVATFDVEVFRGAAVDPEFVTRIATVVPRNTVRLVPRAAAAAPSHSPSPRFLVSWSTLDGGESRHIPSADATHVTKTPSKWSS